MFENQKKGENLETKEFFLHKSTSFRHRIYSLSRRADAKWSADIIYSIWGISL